MVKNFEQLTPAFDLFDADGERKYLTVAERDLFLAQVNTLKNPDTRMIINILAYTGARISEPLYLRPIDFDIAANALRIVTEKQQHKGRGKTKPVVVKRRQVAIPQWLMFALAERYDIRRLQQSPEHGKKPIFTLTRQTIYRGVKTAMAAADLSGPKACPKGLRHCAGVAFAQSGMRDWTLMATMGHSSLSATKVYTQLVGSDLYEQASKTWRKPQ